MTGLVSLFLGSLLASTVLPGGVEILLYYLLHEDGQSWSVLLTVATIGNSLGGGITYLMGRILYTGIAMMRWHERVERAFRLDSRSMSRVKRWGVPALFFSWLPVVGDPLCLAGGYLRLPVWRSMLMICVGKFARYCVLLWLYSQPWATVPA